MAWQIDLLVARTSNRIVNISNLRYADDTTLMAENKEELNNLFMNLKEETEKVA